MSSGRPRKPRNSGTFVPISLPTKGSHKLSQMGHLWGFIYWALLQIASWSALNWNRLMLGYKIQIWLDEQKWSNYKGEQARKWRSAMYRKGRGKWKKENLEETFDPESASSWRHFDAGMLKFNKRVKAKWMFSSSIISIKSFQFYIFINLQIYLSLSPMQFLPKF